MATVVEDRCGRERGWLRLGRRRRHLDDHLPAGICTAGQAGQHRRRSPGQCLHLRLQYPHHPQADAGRHPLRPRWLGRAGEHGRDRQRRIILQSNRGRRRRQRHGLCGGLQQQPDPHRDAAGEGHHHRRAAGGLWPCGWNRFECPVRQSGRHRSGWQRHHLRHRPGEQHRPPRDPARAGHHPRRYGRSAGQHGWPWTRCTILQPLRYRRGWQRNHLRVRSTQRDDPLDHTSRSGIHHRRSGRCAGIAEWRGADQRDVQLSDWNRGG